MTKVITLVKTSGMTPAEFRDYWRGPWTSSLLEMPEVHGNLARAALNYIIPSDLRSDEDMGAGEWAGVAEFWYYDRPSAERFISSQNVRRAIAAHTRAIPDHLHLHVREMAGWDLDGSRRGPKTMSFFLPRPGMTRADAIDHWSNDHLRLTARLGLSQKFATYIQNHTVPEYHNANPHHDFAGGLEAWFASADAAASIFADEDLLSELKDDEAVFLDQDNTMMFMVEEEMVFKNI